MKYYWKCFCIPVWALAIFFILLYSVTPANVLTSDHLWVKNPVSDIIMWIMDILIVIAILDAVIQYGKSHKAPDATPKNS